MQKRFESAFDNAPIGMALIAMDGRWLQVNDALCRITGRTGDELKSTTLAAITHPDDAGIDARGLAQLLTGQVRSNQVEARLRHAWGHDVWVDDLRRLARPQREPEPAEHRVSPRLRPGPGSPGGGPCRPPMRPDGRSRAGRGSPRVVRTGGRELHVLLSPRPAAGVIPRPISRLCPARRWHGRCV